MSQKSDNTEFRKEAIHVLKNMEFMEIAMIRDFITASLNITKSENTNSPPEIKPKKTKPKIVKNMKNEFESPTFESPYVRNEISQIMSMHSSHLQELVNSPE